MNTTTLIHASAENRIPFGGTGVPSSTLNGSIVSVIGVRLTLFADDACGLQRRSRTFLQTLRIHVLYSDVEVLRNSTSR